MRHFHEFLRDNMPDMRTDMYDIFTTILPPLKHQHLSPLLDRDAILHAKHHYVRFLFICGPGFTLI